jgi:hypothetical protein
MLPSFDPPARVESPENRVEGWFGYAYGETSWSGAHREVPPAMVCGTRRDHLEPLGRLFGATYHSPVCTGSINVEELLPETDATAITLDFFNFVFAGIEQSDRLFHAARHQKILKATKQKSTDIHFMAMTLLARTGQIFRPYYTKADFYPFVLWAEKVNYQYGLSSPYDPQKRRLTQPRVYASDSEQLVEIKCAIGRAARIAFDAHKLRAGASVLAFLNEQPGISKARHDGRRVLVLHEELGREVSLNAMVFNPTYEEDEVRARIAKQRRLSQDEVEARFAKALEARTDRHRQRFGARTITVRGGDAIERQKTPSPSTNLYDQTITSDSARRWCRLIALDRKLGKTLGKIGEDRSRRRDAERVEQERSAQTLEHLRRGIEAVAVVVAGLDRAMEAARLPVAGPRKSDLAHRGIVKHVRRFDAALLRLGGCHFGWPGSVQEVVVALGRTQRGGAFSSKEERWFENVEELRLRADVAAWLRLCDSSRADELDHWIQLVHSHRKSTRGIDIAKNPAACVADDGVVVRAPDTKPELQIEL